MAGKRIGAIDMAKAVAMIAVVVGHSANVGVSEGVVNWCFSFHMPLFLIVSGFFTHADARLDGAFVRKLARSLLLPYAITCVLVIVLAAVRAALLEPGEVLSDVVLFAKASLWGAGGIIDGMPTGFIGIGAIWFLLALFWAKLFLAAANSSPCPLAVVLCLLVAGASSDGVWLPLSLQPGMAATFYLYVGQKTSELRLLEPGVLHPLLWGAMALVWLYSAAFYGHLYMVTADFDDGLIDIVGSVCGSLVIIKLCMLAEKRAPRASRPLAALGAATLPMLCAHLIELDTFPWDQVTPVLEAALPVPLVVSGLALRFALVAALMVLLYVLPRPISGAFYPARRAQKAAR